MGRTWQRMLPLGVAVLGLALFVSAAPSQASDEPAGNLVEEVRLTQAGGYIIERHILIDRSVEPDTAAVADTLAGTAPGDRGIVTAQYVLNRWRWPASAIPVAVAYNPASENGMPSLRPMIIDALQQWSSVSGSAFKFTFAGTTSAHSGACDPPDGSPDGINVVEYVSTLGRGVLGMTCTIQTPDGRTLVEFDMQIGSQINWGTGPSIAADKYDLASTVLHEMGHAAGIGHSAIKGTVMYPTLALNTMRRTLTQDDMDAIRADYPGDKLSPQPAPTPVFQRSFEAVIAGIARD